MTTTGTTTASHRVVDHPSGAVVLNASGEVCARFEPATRTLYGGTVEQGVRYTCPEQTCSLFLTTGTAVGHATRLASYLDRVTEDNDLPF